MNITETSVDSLKLLHRGKVRDVYEVDRERLLLVATDRLSAFDCVLPTPIRHKGTILTALSQFWFEKLASIVPNHLITSDLDHMPDVITNYSELRGRSMLVRRTEVFPVECVVRGYLEGSGWKEYQAKNEICGNRLPRGLRQCDRLPEPILTPATKAAEGHDENIDFDRFASIIGNETAAELRRLSLELYTQASRFAAAKGIVVADTKFEFGRDSAGRVLLIDEVLTPDSSRFWDANSYSPGQAQPSFDKQFVREYLETLEWDKQPPAPPLPVEVAAATTERYTAAYELLTGKNFVS